MNLTVTAWQVVAAASAAIAVLAVIALAWARTRALRPDAGAGAVAGLAGQIETVRGEIRRLNDLFLVPRTRGVVGETLLAELLGAWLPPKSFDLQFGFPSGARVDAVVRLGDRLVAIDSKFPLEAFQRFESSDADRNSPLPADLRRAVAKHVDDIAERYIRPEHGTLSFALMYIPSDRIYSELFAARQSDLLAEALRRSVVPVGPSTLFLYLQTVAYGLRGLAIPAETRRLMEQLDRLHAELGALQKSFRLAGGHLRNMVNAFDESSAALDRVVMRAERLTGRGESSS